MDSWNFDDLSKALNKEEQSTQSKYRTWGGWDILSDKTKDWSSSLEIHDPRGETVREDIYQTLNPSTPFLPPLSTLEPGAKEFKPSSPKQLGTGEHRQANPSPLSQRNDNGFLFIVKTFEVEVSRHLLLYNIPSSLSVSDLHNIMSAYGEIDNMNSNRKNDIGVVLLSYFDIRDARHALTKLSQPSMPVEAQFCVNPAVGLEVDKFDEHRLKISGKENSHRGLTLNDLMQELGSFGEILNFHDGKNGEKVVEFPDVRVCRMAYENSRQSNKLNVELVEVSPRLHRLGLSLNKFLNSTSANQGVAATDIKSTEYPSMTSRDNFGDLSLPQSAAFQQNPMSPLNGSSSTPFIPSTEQAMYSQHYRPKKEFLPEHDQSYRFNVDGGVGVNDANKRLSSRGSHPHHQSLARGVQRKKTASTEFMIDLWAVRSGNDIRTSLMVRNIPNKYDLRMVLKEIDVNFERKYDFFYLPIDFKNRCNVGYAFINFIDFRDIESFYQTFNDRKWKRFNSEKVCQITYARLQGKDKLVNRFQNSSLMEKDEECRPLVFHSTGPMKGLPASFPSIG